MQTTGSELPTSDERHPSWHQLALWVLEDARCRRSMQGYGYKVPNDARHWIHVGQGQLIGE